MAVSTPVQLDLFNHLAFMAIDTALDETLQKHIEQHIDLAAKHVRYAAYHPSTIFANIDAIVGDQLFVNGTAVPANRNRLMTFNANHRCVSCGIEANVFLLERHRNDRETARSLNLYAIQRGKMVLITVDHIMPDSLAGRYSYKNFQTMCSDCNRKKQNFMSQEEINRVRANMDDHVKSWAYRPYVEMLLTFQEHMLLITDKKQRNRWASALTKASKPLAQSHSTAQRYMPQHVKNLQHTLNSLLGIEAKPVVVRVQTVYERFYGWMVKQIRFLRSIRIVAQPAK